MTFVNFIAWGFLFYAFMMFITWIRNIAAIKGSETHHHHYYNDNRSYHIHSNKSLEDITGNTNDVIDVTPTKPRQKRLHGGGNRRRRY